MADWLEKELARQFAPVPAPESLWCRIHEQRRPLRVRRMLWPVWCAAALALVLSAGMVRQFAMSRDAAADLEKLTEREVRSVADGSATVDFHSDNPGEIRAWVKAKSGIDIPLRDCLPPGDGTVRLLGARLIRLKGLSVAAITFQVGEDFAAMLVAGSHAVFRGTGSGGHAAPRINAAGNMRGFSWNLGEQIYTIALAGTNDPQRACLLCHADLNGRMAFN